LKYYIATSFQNKEAHAECHRYFADMGYELTFDWTVYPFIPDPYVLHTVATREIDAVKAADFVVVILPGGRGTHIELGAALAHAKPVFVVAPHPQQLLDWQGLPVPFYYHSSVQVVARIENIPPKLEAV
jgi:hypothetical protein